MILTVTGVMLMFFYVPSTERAYGSIKDLQYAVSFGRLLRNQHRWAAEGHGGVGVYPHGAGVFYRRLSRRTGAELAGREWRLLLGTLMLSFTGYLLPWDQLAYWAITVGTNIAGEAPVLGPTMRYLLLGGNFVGQQTLLRFYVLHVFFLPRRGLGDVRLPHVAGAQGRRDGGDRAAARDAQGQPKERRSPRATRCLESAPGTSVAVIELDGSGGARPGSVFAQSDAADDLVFLVVLNVTLLLAMFFNAPLGGTG